MKPAVWSLTAAALCVAVSVSADEIAPTDLYSLPEADIYVLGEFHDNPEHHAYQAIAAEAVGANALVFEMLTDDLARQITPEIRGDRAALSATSQWEQRGWPDFDAYYPIFTAAPEAAIFGGSPPQGEVRRAVSDGSAAVLGDAASMFQLDMPLPAQQQARREAVQSQAHCGALPDEVLDGMVEAQRLRDASLARAAIAAHAETGGPVVMITGNGHARTDWGVPAALALAAPNLSVLSVGQLERDPREAPPYDLWLVTDGVDRGDPCEAFE